MEADDMVSLHVNGQERNAEPDRNLLQYIRFDLGLTGTKFGCGEGLCGACTVIVDGQAIKSCLTTAGAVAGGSIVTIEGLAPEGKLNVVQQAFVEESAMQCGYCIPGFIMTSTALLDRDAKVEPAQIREALAGHICRCGTYQRILKAVESAAKKKGAQA
ncbi:MAG: (2Fe-2S)-binding protein [Dehalococcoidia bacterium]|nr:(2Fe-2S)-binding protein [Dehalococcoidia bacterium]